ncbi:MAG: hypothetical protein M1814_006248 [Vezdaea aestivalis]|nr:MAG: hypothetical protein M1814_006248 [Vezdaea aestivalis]
MRIKANGLAAGFLLFVSASSALGLPYISASLFSANINGDDLVYAFLPSTSSPSSFQLQRLNVSGKLETGISPWTTLSSTLPFLSAQSPAFVPAADNKGNMVVYAGNCSAGRDGASLWTYTPGAALEGTDGKWTKRGSRTGQLGTSPILDGANYLSSGIVFSSTVNDTAERQSLFAFGGMCPNSSIEGGNAWTNLAKYSNSMLGFTPSGVAGNLNYELDLVQSKGPPVAEAGFSVTALEPSYMNRGIGKQTQQQNFVLLGGHTSTAFINTSQVALFSLPEQGWTFTQVRPVGSRIDLAVRDDPVEIEPRSGHTAVLSADGKSIIVLGGWVGDIETPAQPQMAVLNLGEKYGGSSDWTWSTVKQTGLGLARDQGIYGHGATMLPGGVMMVTGGILVTSPSSRRRDSAPSTSMNRRTLFYNTSSNSWVPTYINPLSSALPPVQTSTSGLSPTSRRLAIGLGVALGLIAILGAILVCLWYLKRLRKRREARERDLRSLAAGASHYAHTPSHSGSGPTSVDGRSGYNPSGDWAGVERPNSGAMTQNSAYPWVAPAGYERRNSNGGNEAERTGLLVEVPSPTRGLRRSLHSRGSGGPRPMMAGDRGLGAYEGLDAQNGRRGTSGIIHPIDEQEEYDPPIVSEASGPEMAMTGLEKGKERERPVSDPFRDPVPQPLRSHPLQYTAVGPSTVPQVPPHGNRDRNAAILSWVDTWASSREPPSRQDSGSPEKDRTSSSLSDKSNRSHHTTSSASGPSATISRTLSQRSAAFLSGVLTNPFASSTAGTTVSPAPGEFAALRAPGHDLKTVSPLGHSRQAFHPRPESGGSSSFTTAETSFSTIQAEGATLLHPPSSTDRDLYVEPGSPSKSKPRASTIGWMGNVRKAFRGGAVTTTTSGSRSPSPASNRSSPLKAYAFPADRDGDYGESSVKPRRAISLTTPHSHLQRSPSSSGPGADLAWRQRKGARDWAQSHHESGGFGSVARTQSGRTAASSESGDWDIEAAAEQRVVQVLFTVPRERLRVVNAEAEIDDGEGASEKAEVVQLEEGDAVKEEEEEEEALPVMALPRSGSKRMVVD